MIIQLVTITDGYPQSQEFETDDLPAAMEVRGFKANGRVGSNGLREELRGQPCFTGLAGPMWGTSYETGKPAIRYEDNASCAILSA